jgi:acyl-coenzyme A thioesterase PaaI-like protein
MPNNKHRQRAELFLMGVIADDGFDSTLEGLEVTGGGPGSVVCKLHVSKKLQNRYGTLHGGCIGEGLVGSPTPQWLPWQQQ